VTLGRGIRIIDEAFLRCDKVIYNEYNNGLYLGNEENPYFALVKVSHENAEYIEIHPDTVVICGGAIESCDSIKAITVDGDNPYFKSVDGSLFSGDGSRLIKYAAASEASSYRIPEGTVIIDKQAFDKAINLIEVIIPDSVEILEHSAFINCENLQSIKFGNGLKKIGGQAFGFCSSLTEITIPDSAETVSYNAFSYCTKLEKAVIGSGTKHLGNNTFIGCTSLKEVVFKNPHGWTVRAMYGIFSNKIDVYNPQKNAENLTGEYLAYFWNR
jgi:hypothetical protein